MEFKNDKQLKEKIKEVISMVTKIDYNTLTDNISLRNDLTVDSLQATQIITLLEEEYNKNITLLNASSYCFVIGVCGMPKTVG